MLPKYLKLDFNSLVCQGELVRVFQVQTNKEGLGNSLPVCILLKKVIVFYFNLAVSEERNKEKQT